MTASDRGRVEATLAGIVPWDAIEAEHRDDALAWVRGGAPLWRTALPATPPKHLVAYVVLVDTGRRSVLLVEHRKAGLWLPAGGHVDAGEAPVATALREAREELGVTPRFLDPPGPHPLFVTQATTVGTGAGHRDVSLWFACRGEEDHVLRPDPRELAAVRWWPVEAVRRADPARFDPHLGRFLAKLLATVGAGCERGPGAGPDLSR